MVVSLPREGRACADVGEITCGPSPAMAKAMVSGPGLALASSMACCREPTPVTLVLLTAKVAAKDKTALATQTNAIALLIRRCSGPGSTRIKPQSSNFYEKILLKKPI